MYFFHSSIHMIQVTSISTDTETVWPTVYTPPCLLKFIGHGTIFFSHNKSASAGLRAVESISRTSADMILFEFWHYRTGVFLSQRIGVNISLSEQGLRRLANGPPLTADPSCARQRPCLDTQIHPQILLCKKKIPHHIKMSAHIWSTKCRWNQKLITQFYCTLRDEYFKSN
jgi:hypothetical protein